MKFLLLAILFVSSQIIFSQSLSNSYSTAQIDSIDNGSFAFEGDIYHDYQNNFFFIGVSNGKLVQFISAPSSIVLNKSGGTLPNSSNTYYDFPIGSTDIQSIDSNTFQVVGNGKIKVLKAGTYSITAGLSCNNMPAGGTKYIIGMKVNGGLRGYISRGFVTLPNPDYWGSSGVIIYNFNTNDIINIQYVLNAGITLNTVFINLGVNKL